jgi:hypothetical protein
MLAPRRVRPYCLAKPFFFVGREKPDTQVIFRLAPDAVCRVLLDLFVLDAEAVREREKCVVVVVARMAPLPLFLGTTERSFNFL